MTMTGDGLGFDEEIETRPLASGWEAVMHYGDGSATKAWGATEAEAEAKLSEVIDGDGVTK